MLTMSLLEWNDSTYSIHIEKQAFKNITWGYNGVIQL